MIACAFILCVNIAVVKTLFNWSSLVFSDTTDNIAASGVSGITNSSFTFGHYSMLWLSAILTFFLMYKIFEMTRKKLNDYSGIKTDLYDNVVKSGKRLFDKTTSVPGIVKKWFK